MKIILILLVLTSCKNIKTENEIRLESELKEANKSILYYRTQYLKANTQLIEVKQKCIYCTD